MKKDRNRVKIVIFLTALVILVFLIAMAYGFYDIEYRNNEFNKEIAAEGYIDHFYRLYLVSEPDIEGRSYYGREDAGITLVAYIYPGSDISRYFFKDVLPQLMGEFINTGNVRFYPKNYLTIEDFREKNERFIYAQSQLCVNKLKQDSFHDFYFKLFDINNITEIAGLVEEYGISGKDFSRCLEEQEFDELKRDILEVETFGAGNPRFYIGLMAKYNTVLDGVPSYTRFRRVIREYQTIIGE
ncbi:hypothetical protein KY345_05160 [Candidatus Woesearchaeota archaeon]|nr:hypothetical protein [Candidatus Woesearchaeota archaeon]